MTSPAEPRAIPDGADVSADTPPVPELRLDTADALAALAELPTFPVEGRPGHFEHLLGVAPAALEAGALVVYAPSPPGWPAPLRVRLYRWNGSAWYFGRWQGRGEWYANCHVPAAVPWDGRRTVNVYLGRWRAPGVRSRAVNARHDTPPPLSPAGVRRAVALVAVYVGRRGPELAYPGRALSAPP